MEQTEMTQFGLRIHAHGLFRAKRAKNKRIGLDLTDLGKTGTLADSGVFRFQLEFQRRINLLTTIPQHTTQN
eukprot:6576195-Prorocentrum_lima.AAC.1